MYENTPQESTESENTLDIRDELSKQAGYKLNIQKSIFFL